MVRAMSNALRKPLTLSEFLAWEETQPLKYEFDGLSPMAMTGVSAAHAALQVNLITSLRTRLRGSPCRPFGSDLKIEVAGRIRYPDAFVACTPVAAGATVVKDPVVVFEILSDATAHIDHGAKNREYEATPSIRRYVIFEQDAMAATIFAREGKEWLGRMLTGPDAILDLPEIGLHIPLAELYADIDLVAPALV